jgi:mono/diheme cytochrome c family protein
VAAPALAGPRLTPEHRVFDFGTVLQGRVVEHSFPFTNTGDADLVIGEVTTPCGCTAVVAGKTVIAPGESSTIDATYDSAARSGDVERVITVRSNDPEEPEMELTLHTHVDASMHTAFKSGETLFGEKCGSCHAEPAEGLSGQALYDAVCWFCHGTARQGKTAAPLGPYPAAVDPEITRLIGGGIAGTEMPAFAKGQGGPLDDAQIRSLVELLHTPLPEPPPEEPEAEPAAIPEVGNPDAPFFD